MKTENNLRASFVPTDATFKRAQDDSFVAVLKEWAINIAMIAAAVSIVLAIF